ncbi:MAG TPA: family 10 glycosylhydrolase [Nocardiopsis listeri]|uniref:glycoside hydrolase family 10 protein n=1 Tax=Nocardiopsis listeri TaxID=53440 RepID=UPI001D35686F|nr:family 10 glycosylhydrolase [Nocardiopsis listeri]HJE61137.1 family 10 glycosylhydrolase [Nocardiopsis listeri]
MRSMARALTKPRAGGRWAAIAATATVLLAGCSTNGQDPSSDDAPEPGGEGIAAPVSCQAHDDKRQMRGAWLTTVRNIDWPSEPGLSADEQKAELDAWLDDSVEMGLNAVFLHARPTADAVYDSELEPWARYLTGEQGGDPGYDPLEYAVEEAHERGLELHAWFNPYRVGLQDPDVENLADDHPVEQNPEWLVDFGTEAYVDPGNPEVREWVTEVIMDVVDRYDVDGMHFDDFFYPYPQEGETFDDDASWQAHGGDFDDRGDWRRDNVDQLMRDVHGRIQESKPWVSFGVSPFGIWRNDSTDPSGSPSSGLQSYDAQYADTRTWIEEGTVDYVAPQLYWERGFETADYEAMTDWWSNEVEGTDVDLYVGQGAYRLGEDGWTGDDALSNQLDYSGELDEVSGDIYFSIKNLRDNGDVVDHLLDGHYADSALPPVIENPEGDGPLVGAVDDVSAKNVDRGVEVEWDETEDARFYALYRLSAEAVQALESQDEDAYCTALTADNLVGTTGGSALTDTDPLEDGAGYVVTALDDYRAEGPISEVADVRS